MKLSDLLATIQPVRIAGSTNMEITGVNIDSRLIETGHLFMGLSLYCVKNCRKSSRPASPTFW